MYNIDYVGMGQRIAARRKELKLTQETLAEKVGVSTSHIGEIERATSICSLAVIVNISIALEMNLDILIKGINHENANQALSEIYESVPDDNKKLYIKLCEGVADKLK